MRAGSLRTRQGTVVNERRLLFVPANPKIYHITPFDRLASIVSDGYLWSDAEARRRQVGGSTIGIYGIKQNRLTNELSSHPGLHVGECVPFYFCPRSVMLYMNYKQNSPSLSYQGGQDTIVHLEADLHRTAEWAQANDRRWAFTTSNAGSNYFVDYSDLRDLDKINWDAVSATWWSDPPVKEGKQAEFLVEYSFPWHLVSRIGIRTDMLYNAVQQVLRGQRNRPKVEVKPGWYY